MARRRLKKIGTEERQTFTGTFVRYGRKPGYRKGSVQRTLLLEDVRDDQGNIVAEQLWFNLTKGFADLGTLESGDRVRFDARVKRYPRRKGKVTWRTGVDRRGYKRAQFGLSFPTRISRMEEPK